MSHRSKLPALRAHHRVLALFPMSISETLFLQYKNQVKNIKSWETKLFSCALQLSTEYSWSLYLRPPLGHSFADDNVLPLCTLPRIFQEIIKLTIYEMRIAVTDDHARYPKPLKYCFFKEPPYHCWVGSRRIDCLNTLWDIIHNY
jgi:hypothetical protein